MNWEEDGHWLLQSSSSAFVYQDRQKVPETSGQLVSEPRFEAGTSKARQVYPVRRTIMNSDCCRMCKETTAAYFKVLLRYSPV
jgi:hypothetical protein